LTASGVKLLSRDICQDGRQGFVHKDQWITMVDEIIAIPSGALEPLPQGDDFERMLELLIAIAKADGRPFLAYLLGMALMEARNNGPSQAQGPH
jgi:hypothetical protein